MSFAVTALGELLVDFTESGLSAGGQRLFEQNPGGAPANLLVALKRLGMDTAFIGKVGRDMHGEFLRRTLESEGVETRGLIDDEAAFTTLAFVSIAENGERSFSFARSPGADIRLRPEEVDTELIKASRVFHTGSLSLTDEPARSATLFALKQAKAAGCIISCDPNYRAPLWPDEQTAKAQMRSILPYADLIKLSDGEAALLTGCAEPEAAAERLLAGGASVVAVTLGSGGAYVRTRQGEAAVPAFRVEAVDTTGAGDCFWGAFLCCLIKSGTPPAEVTAEQAVGFAGAANAAAALCVQRRGGIPAMPTLAELEEFLKQE